VQVLRSALVSMARGRARALQRDVSGREIAHQGSVSLKFFTSVPPTDREAQELRARGRVPARSRDRVLETEQGHKMKGRLIVGVLAAVPMLAAAVAAQAADIVLPVRKAAPPAPSLATNWNGFYFGAHAGAGWGSTNADFIDPAAPFRWDSSIPINGPLVGGQIGYNWQSGWALFGIEADGSWSNITGHSLCNTTAFIMNCSSKVEGVATLTGRLGASVERALIYFKGGGAWARDNETISNVALPPIPTAFSSSTSVNRYGWTIGMGIEYAFLPNWSAKVEYDFIDFGTKTYSFPITSTVVAPTNFTNWSVTSMIHEMKIGVNYHF
jgi:outer membrane immunogenic protein